MRAPWLVPGHCGALAKGSDNKTANNDGDDAAGVTRGKTAP